MVLGCLCGGVGGLRLERDELAEGSLAALAVVGPFDPGHDGHAQLVAVSQRRRLRTLTCCTAKKFSSGAVPCGAAAVPRADHAVVVHGAHVIAAAELAGFNRP